MAVPIIPLVIVGMGLLVLGRRKRPAKKKAEGELPAVPFHTVVFLPPKEPAAPTGPSGQAGRPCEGKGGDGAFDELGSCKTFWIDGDTDEAIGRLAREEWEARGRPRASEMCFMVDDPLGGRAVEGALELFDLPAGLLEFGAEGEDGVVCRRECLGQGLLGCGVGGRHGCTYTTGSI